MRRRALVQFSLSLPALGIAHAQERYPSRPIRIVVPYAVGGNTDVLGRIYAQKLSELLGQPVVVENRTGAGIVVGTDAVAKSAPDGYTLLIGTSAHTIAPSLYDKLPYDTARDLKPVSVFAEVPMVLSVHPRIPAHDARALVALLRKNPGKFNFGSSGNGGSLHMAVELLKHQQKVSALHIPYRGAGPALSDAVAGQFDFIIDPISTSLPFIKAGRLRALAVTTATRSPLLPDVATMKEQGFSDYETSTWNVLLVPAAVPNDIVQKLADAMTQINADPAVRKRLAEIGVNVVKSDPAHAARYLESERAKWAAVIKSAGIKPD